MDCPSWSNSNYIISWTLCDSSDSTGLICYSSAVWLSIMTRVSLLVCLVAGAVFLLYPSQALTSCLIREFVPSSHSSVTRVLSFLASTLSSHTHSLDGLSTSAGTACLTSPSASCCPPCLLPQVLLCQYCHGLFVLSFMCDFTVSIYELDCVLMPSVVPTIGINYDSMCPQPLIFPLNCYCRPCEKTEGFLWVLLPLVNLFWQASQALYCASSLSTLIGAIFIWGKSPVLAYWTALLEGLDALLLQSLIISVTKLDWYLGYYQCIFDCVFNKFNVNLYLAIVLMVIGWSYRLLSV